MATETKPGDLVHTGSGDKPMRISREIPLPWLIAMVAGIVGQAGALYYGQQEHARLLATLADGNREAKVEIKAVGQSVSTVNLSLVKHEMLIDDMRQRMGSVEGELRKAGK